MPSLRTILHADMDAFFAAIEQRDDPTLRGKPVIVGGLGRRGVVSAASYEARVFGVHSALPTALARERCPGGHYLEPRMEVYAHVSRQLRDVLDRYTPQVEPLSLDEAFLDVTGSYLLFGDGEACARALKREVLDATGLRVSVGVAANKFVAKVASDHGKPDGLCAVAPGVERAFLAPLPLSRLWGAGPVARARLEGLGLLTIGDLQQLPPGALDPVLGAALGARLLALARGEDARGVETARDAKSLSHERTFDRDLAGEEACRRVLLDLSERVCARLRAQGLAARVLRLKLRHPPFQTLLRQRRVTPATNDELRVYREVLALYDAANPKRRPLRLLGVGASELESETAPRQAELFGGGRRRQSLLRAIDAIRARFGKDALRRGGV